ncbi:MAG: LytR/AlgR family response regulator transcription factor [Gemmatimonadales bacterium]
MAIRALIVEDERLTRRDLREQLDLVPEITVIGEAASLADAATMIAEHDPELVFLDIQLGKESGFDLLTRAPARFDVIFVTAYDEFAVRAFELGAVHYLLKPVELAKLQEAVRRLTSKERPPGDDGPFREGDRIFVKAGSTWRFVEIRAIKWIEAVGDYTRVHLADRSAILMDRPMRDWEVKLPARLFRRVHRSTIVNLDHVARVEEWSASTFHLYLAGVDEPVRMSRRYAARLRR